MDDVIVNARGHMAAKQQASIVRGHQSPQPHANKKDDKHPGDNPARAPCPRKKLLHHRDRKHHGHTPKQGMVCQRSIKVTGKKRQPGACHATARARHPGDRANNAADIRYIEQQRRAQEDTQKREGTANPARRDPWKRHTHKTELRTHTCVVCSSHGVGVLDDDVHRKNRAQTAQERADNLPHQNGGAVLLELQAITRSVGLHTVADLVIPPVGIEAASDDGQQDELRQARCGLSVVLAHDVHITSQFIQEVPRVDAAGDDGEDNSHRQAAIGLYGHKRHAAPRRNRRRGDVRVGVRLI